MRIGLIDVDSHHKSGFPNLALMKLASWHKSQGDDVDWYTPFDHYDKVYMAKVFTFTQDYQYVINNADEIQKGGTGYGEPYVALPDEIDRCKPDYSIYNFVDKHTAYGFLTRGCIRKCPWCIVPKKEGAIKPYMDIEEIAVDGRNRIILMDNNILAAGDYSLNQIEKIIKLGVRIDFNQAMDARLVTPEIAKLLARVKWIDVIRFGCDTPAQIDHCERAIKLIQSFGFTGLFDLYTMLHGSIEECYNRTSRWRAPEYNHRVIVNPQPMLDLTRQVQNIPLWQRAMARWGSRKQIYFSTDFKDYCPRKGMTGRDFFNNENNVE